jgi:hypothetical protein
LIAVGASGLVVPREKHVEGVEAQEAALGAPDGRDLEPGEEIGVLRLSHFRAHDGQEIGPAGDLPLIVPATGAHSMEAAFEDEGREQKLAKLRDALVGRLLRWFEVDRNLRPGQPSPGGAYATRPAPDGSAPPGAK